MPVPGPNSGEDKQHYLSRCIALLVGEGRLQEQAAAICYDQWKNKEEDEDEHAFGVHPLDGSMSMICQRPGRDSVSSNNIPEFEEPDEMPDVQIDSWWR